ncbi:MAG: hypothetical protein WCR80_06875 [Bacilli bacterium]
MAKQYIDRNGESTTRLYRIWADMKTRCNNDKHKQARDYKGRNIKIYKDWYDFSSFKEWALNNGYLENLTLERIDNDGNYCPDNCTWASRQEQALNRRDNIYVNVKMVLAEVCRVYSLPYESTRKRLKKGQNINQIIKERRFKNGRKNF